MSRQTPRKLRCEGAPGDGDESPRRYSCRRSFFGGAFDRVHCLRRFYSWGGGLATDTEFSGLWLHHQQLEGDGWRCGLSMEFLKGDDA